MAIELFILSGARQDERLLFDATTLRVGDDDSCDVYFDAAVDKNAKGRLVTIHRSDDGWRIKNNGTGQVWLNHQAVEKELPIRSGDIVRMSEQGPEFSFAIVSQAVADAAAAATLAAAATDDRDKGATAAPSAAASEGTASEGTGPTQTSDDDADRRQAVPPRPALATTDHYEPATNAAPTSTVNDPDDASRTRVLSIAAAGSLAAALIAWLLWPATPPRPPRLPDFGNTVIKEGEQFSRSARVVDPGKPVGTLRYSLIKGQEYGMEIDAATGDMRWTTSEEHGPGDYDVTVQVVAASEDHQANDKKTFTVSVLEVNRPPSLVKVPNQTVHQDVKPDPWAVAETVVRASTMLIVGSPPHSTERFPFGTATVIAHKAAVTSGVLAGELGRRQKEGWKIALWHPDTESKVEVDQVFVHQGFEMAAEQPAVQIYFDVGMLQTTHPMEHVATLASEKTLNELERGQPLGCVAIGHDGQPLTRFKRPTASLTRAETNTITQLAATAPAAATNAPRLLHVAGGLDRNIYGCPIVNQQGEVVAIYAEQARLPDDARQIVGTDLHYAPLITLVRSWNTTDRAKLWTIPKRPAAPNPGDKPRTAAPPLEESDE